MRRETQREEWDATMKTDVGGLQLRVEDRQPSPGARSEPGTGSPSEPSGELALLTPGFQIPSLQNCRRIKLCCVQLPGSWYFVTAALGN